MKIHMTTFNILGVDVPDNDKDQIEIRKMVETWIYNDIYTKVHQRNKGDFVPDIFVVGLQEMVPMNIQGFLESSEKAANQWSSIIVDILNMKIGKGIVYIPGEPLTMFGLALFVFVRQELNPLITRYDRDNIRTGGWGPLSLGEKGGVAISMTVGSTTMCFVNVHLAAGDGNLPHRIEHWNEIRDDLSFDNDIKLEDHEYVFWLGDMNSRLVVQTYDDSEKVQAAINDNKWSYLVAAHDELTLERVRPPSTYHTSMFHGYKEGLVTFAPTYKYQVGTQMFVNETPSFTDRILWRRKGLGLEANEDDGKLVLYDSTQIVTISDHRPVTALMDIPLQLPPTQQSNPNNHPPPLPLHFATVEPANNHVPASSVPTQEIVAEVVPHPNQTVPQQAQTVPQQFQTVPQQFQTVPQQFQTAPQQFQTIPYPGQNAPQPSPIVRQPKIILENVASTYDGQGAAYPLMDQTHMILNAPKVSPAPVPAPAPAPAQNPYSTDRMMYVLNQVNHSSSTNMPVANARENLAHYNAGRKVTCHQNEHGTLSCHTHHRHEPRHHHENPYNYGGHDTDSDDLSFSDTDSDTDSESSDEFESVIRLPRQRIQKRIPANPMHYGKPNGGRKFGPRPGQGPRRMRSPPQRQPTPAYGSDSNEREQPPPEVMAYVRNSQQIQMVEPVVSRPPGPAPGVLYELYPTPVYDMKPPAPMAHAPSATMVPEPQVPRPPAPPQYVTLFGQA